MRFDILTLFPELFTPFVKHGIIGRAIDRGVLEVGLVNIRDFARGPHKETDDRPYGGGAGMVMKPGPIVRALESVRRPGMGTRIVLLTPQGRPLDQGLAWELSETGHLVLICGRYEGVDERVREGHVDIEVSIGDFVLSGGEVAAMAVVDAVSRLVPGVLGCGDSNLEDSFSNGLLEHPQYTRPRVFEDRKVPEVLLSGDHERIRKWRRTESLKRTFQRRPDLLGKTELTEEDREMLSRLAETDGNHSAGDG
ncbi:MAG: tRNA (guanosine(37)-N1)-methyltransferase TrmD [Desulfobacteraceae bacterium]